MQRYLIKKYLLGTLWHKRYTFRGIQIFLHWQNIHPVISRKWRLSKYNKIEPERQVLIETNTVFELKLLFVSTVDFCSTIWKGSSTLTYSSLFQTINIHTEIQIRLSLLCHTDCMWPIKCMESIDRETANHLISGKFFCIILTEDLGHFYYSYKNILILPNGKFAQLELLNNHEFHLIHKRNKGNKSLLTWAPCIFKKLSGILFPIGQR